MTIHALAGKPATPGTLTRRLDALTNAAQTEYGDLGDQVRAAGIRQRSRACYSALSTPARAGCGSRNRLLVRRPKPSHRHGASQPHQSDRGTKALDVQFLVWARITGRSAQGLAWKERKSESWPTSFLSSGQVRQRAWANTPSPWKASQRQLEAR